MADLNLKTVLHDTAGQHLEPIIAEYLTASKEAQEKREQAAALETERARVDEAEGRAAAEKQLSRRMRGLAAIAAFMAISAFVAWAVVFGQFKALGAKNVDLEVAKATSDANAVAAATSAAAEKTAKEDALVANQIARSLMLANQAQDSSSIEDALLLAHAATRAYSSTLLANAALLDALDDSYRLDNGTMTAYVPHEQLDFAAAGPWQAEAFSQDGRVLALSDATGGITLWDNASGKPIGGRLAAHGEYPVYTLAFDPTGPRLLSATGDRNNPTAARHDLVLWDLADPAAPTHQVLAQQPTGHLVGRLAS